MSIELKIPEVGESVREVQIGRWLKHEGDSVAQDENVVELETDKASMELPAPAAGVLGQILKQEGEMVVVGDVIGYVENGDQTTGKKSEPAAATQKPQPETPARQSSAKSPKKAESPTTNDKPIAKKEKEAEPTAAKSSKQDSD